MKTTKDKIITCVLTPVSWIYASVMWVRNKLFDIGVLKEEKFDVPVVGVGNITVGGTGKTPHVEYIVSNLASVYNIAVLSRGYRRRTRGFILANSKSTPELIGDEPYQIYQKYGVRVQVAVCESRRKGIRELLKAYPDIQLIVLDDAFQHRYVKPKVSILLMDYNRPINKDHILPLGRLRESPSQVQRADMVVVTKCPETLMPIDYRLVSKELDLMSYQKLFFSRFEYGGLMPVFPDDSPYYVMLGSLTSSDGVFLLTGIAHPRYFVRYFKNYPFKVRVNHFPDHHDFSRADLQDIKRKFDGMPGERKIIVTTEKDAVRLLHNPYFPRELKPFTFYLPIAVKMVNGLDDSDFIAQLRTAIDKTDIMPQS